MSKIALIAILIIVVVAGFGVLYLQGYLGGSSMAPVSTGVPDPREENSTTTSAADSGAPTQPAEPSQPAAAGGSADASSDTSMDADMQSIDTQMQGLDSDNTSLDASANDEPISQ